jgi:hypothetical protein
MTARDLEKACSNVRFWRHVQTSPLCSITASSRASTQFLTNSILLCSPPDCRAVKS